jgi:hypothetical protein
MSVVVSMIMVTVGMVVVVSMVVSMILVTVGMVAMRLKCGWILSMRMRR